MAGEGFSEVHGELGKSFHEQNNRATAQSFNSSVVTEQSEDVWEEEPAF